MKQLNLVQPFLMTSVPKSGSHLLIQILTGLPNVVPKDGYYVHDHPDYINNHRSRLPRLQKNEFGYGHVYYTEEYAEMLNQLGIKHVFLYRDPRDVLVSLAYYIPRLPNHPLYVEFKTTLISTRDRLLALLLGKKGTDFQDYFHVYDWIHNKKSFHLSFEELVKSDESKKECVSRLAQFLLSETTPLPSEVTQRMIHNINPTSSPTFRKSRIGDWKIEFDQEIKSTFKDLYGDRLVQLGYETDTSW